MCNPQNQLHISIVLYSLLGLYEEIEYSQQKEIKFKFDSLLFLCLPFFDTSSHQT